MGNVSVITFLTRDDFLLDPTKPKDRLVSFIPRQSRQNMYRNNGFPQVCCANHRGTARADFFTSICRPSLAGSTVDSWSILVGPYIIAFFARRTQGARRFAPRFFMLRIRGSHLNSEVFRHKNQHRAPVGRLLSTVRSWQILGRVCILTELAEWPVEKWA